MISAGKCVSVALSFGVLEAKDKKVTFTFDSAALSKGGSAQLAPRDGDSDVSDYCATDAMKGWDEQLSEGFPTYRWAYHVRSDPFLVVE